MLISVVFQFILIFTNLCCYYYFRKNECRNNQRNRTAIERCKLILHEEIEDVRRKQHDFKNYINTINGIVETSEQNEIKKTLRNYLDILVKDSNEIDELIYIDDLIIKSIIYSVNDRAKNRGIDFKFNVDKNTLINKFNSYDITHVVNNLINNAFDAVEKSEGKREVILNVFKQGNKDIVEVRNHGIYFDDCDIINIFRRGYSTKEGKKRGYGLHNVQKIANKNGGKVDLYFENNYTCFMVTC